MEKRIREGRSAEERRAERIRDLQAETGITEAMIATLVERFYERVRRDPLIGPVFETRIADWEPHLEAMRRFWSSVTLASGTYQGQPMRKHLPLPIERRHFDRWLALFGATALEVCPLPAARRFVDQARRIAESLELGIANSHGILLKDGERFETAKGGHP